MAFHNIPPNGFPDIPDMEELEAVVKDVTSLKNSVAGLATDVSNLSDNKANQITIAPFFNAETAYEVGDLVYYNGLSYRCTNDHEGEWDADDFAATTVAGELATLKSGLTELTANDVSGYDDITASTHETSYVCPTDGYLYASSESDTTGVIRVVIMDSSATYVVGFIYMNVADEYQIQTLYLKKGFKVYVSSRTANTVVRFNKLGS